MTDGQPDRDIFSEPIGAEMRTAYVRVIVLEVIVLLALWVFGKMFTG